VRRSYQDVQSAQGFLLEAKCLADAALDSIALRGIGRVLSRDQQSKPRRTGIAFSQVEGKAIEAAPNAVAQQLLEIRFAAQPAAGVQPVALSVRG
jgi:hypothetical protein